MSRSPNSGVIETAHDKALSFKLMINLTYYHTTFVSPYTLQHVNIIKLNFHWQTPSVSRTMFSEIKDYFYCSCIYRGLKAGEQQATNKLGTKYRMSKEDIPTTPCANTIFSNPDSWYLILLYTCLILNLFGNLPRLWRAWLRRKGICFH